MNHERIAHDRVKAGLALTATGALTLLLIAGCGGGGGTSSTSASATAPSASTASPTSMTGTVAVGSALSGANVTVIDASGNSVATSSDASGNYTVSLSGMSAPFLIVASDPSGDNPTLTSVVASLPTGTSAPVVANVTTLTTAVAALLTTSGNPLDLSTSGTLTSLVNPSSVSAAVSKLDAALAPILTANNLSATSFDPIGTPFTANQTGADAVIDAVQLVPATSGGSELVSNASTTGTGIPLNQSTVVSAPLTAPPVPANYLASLISSLGQCLAGTSAACSQAIDANYKENGYQSFTAAHPALAAPGVTLGLPKTLTFFTSATGAQQALVWLPYTTATGTAGSTSTVVQQTSSGAWDIIGNQQQYDVTITSFLIRRQFVDTADAPYGRYEAGIGISIPAAGTGTPNPSNLASASVTGPGINGTAYLVPRNGTGNDTLALTGSVQTAVPTGGKDITNSNTNLYRWSWQALPGNTGTYTPPTNNLGFNTPAPINVSSVPPFATYTVTFYDSTGTQIGQPVSVTNPTPPLASSAGAAVPWQTLSSSTQSAFLSPSGSLAGAQTSVSLSWSNLVGNQNIGPLVTKTQIQGVPGTGATPSTEVDGWWIGPATFSSNGQYTSSVTAGVGQNGVQQCTSACQFPALQPGGSRIAELYWNVRGTAYYNLWKYAD